MLKRNLIAVGQGSFNIEHVYNKKIVYDCGSMSLNLIKSQINNYISKGEEIELLVISHLDFDHYSGVIHLFNHAKIKKVILPKLNKVDILILWHSLPKSSPRNLKIARTFLYCFYSEYFDNIEIDKIKKIDLSKTTILYFTREEIDDESKLNFEDVYNIDDLDSSNKILKNNKIVIKSYNFIPRWYLIFYSHNTKKNDDEINSYIASNHINIDSNTFWSDTNKVKELKKEYKRIYGDINYNSLMMYSGSINNFLNTNCLHYNNLHINSNNFISNNSKLNNTNLNNRIGIIFTGDTKLLSGKGLEVFYNYYKPIFNDVFMVQVPHHGSRNNSDEKLLNIFSYKDNFYFLSAKSNSKHHPSYYVVKNYLKDEQILYLVDESDCSTVKYIANYIYY